MEAKEMRKLVASVNISLDGFAAGPNREINWIKIDEELFDFVGTLTDQADTALYGRVTYQMMESYWPTAAKKPSATKHDVEHSLWYNKVDKVVISRTILRDNSKNTKIFGDNIEQDIDEIKRGEGKNILLFGSPTIVRTLTQYNLIDDYWLFLNPIILGEGISLFAGTNEIVKLKLLTSKTFSSGVVGLHYTTTNGSVGK
jgi:dihydrofolate reductase